MPKFNFMNTFRKEPSPILDDSKSINETNSYFVNSYEILRDKKMRIVDYRQISKYPELVFAIDEICNEVIDSSITNKNLIELEIFGDWKEEFKDEVNEQFGKIQTLVEKYDLYQMLYKFIVDGELNYFIQISQDLSRIYDIKFIEPWKIKKITETDIVYNKYTKRNEYAELPDKYEYCDTEIRSNASSIELNDNEIARCESGILDEHGEVLSYLFAMKKTLNDIKNLENSAILYRLVRAPEKRVFYVDTGTLPTQKAEEYVKSVINRFKTRIDYDTNTGTYLVNNQNVVSPISDYYMPRREGSTGSSIEILNETNLDSTGVLDELKYYLDKLFKTLYIPKSRYSDEQSNYSLNSSGEITRDEVKFAQFTARLSKSFCEVFKQLLRTQLIISNTITEKEWNEFSSKISISIVNNAVFGKIKKIELLTKKLDLLSTATDFEEDYLSKEYIWKNVLEFSDEEIEKIIEQQKLESGEEELETEEPSMEEPEDYGEEEPSMEEPLEAEPEEPELNSSSFPSF